LHSTQKLSRLLPLPQYPRHFLQRPAHAQQLVFAEDDQAFVVRVVGGADELDDLRIDGDFLAARVGHGDEGDHGPLVRPQVISRKRDVGHGGTGRIAPFILSD